MDNNYLQNYAYEVLGLDPEEVLTDELIQAAYITKYKEYMEVTASGQTFPKYTAEDFKSAFRVLTKSSSNLTKEQEVKVEVEDVEAMKALRNVLDYKDEEIEKVMDVTYLEAISKVKGINPETGITYPRERSGYETVKEYEAYLESFYTQQFANKKNETFELMVIKNPPNKEDGEPIKQLPAVAVKIPFPKGKVNTGSAGGTGGSGSTTGGSAGTGGSDDGLELDKTLSERVQDFILDKISKHKKEINKLRKKVTKLKKIKNKVLGKTFKGFLVRATAVGLLALAIGSSKAPSGYQPVTNATNEVHAMSPEEFDELLVEGANEIGQYPSINETIEIDDTIKVTPTMLSEGNEEDLSAGTYTVGGYAVATKDDDSDDLVARGSIYTQGDSIATVDAEENQKAGTEEMTIRLQLITDDGETVWTNADDVKAHQVQNNVDQGKAK